MSSAARLARNMALLAGAGLLTAACAAESRPGVTAGVDGCSACGMVIDQVNQACGYFVGKDFQPFCSPGCLVADFEKRRKAGHALPDRIFFSDYLGGGWHAADSAGFLLTRHLPTVMDWEVLAFADSATAMAQKQHEDESVVDWTGLRTLYGTPDRELSLDVSEETMTPDVVELEKGELVEWVIAGRDLGGDLTVELRGYPEMGEITLSESGEQQRVRLLAIRPGAGFPFVRTDSGKVLGQIRVRGPHTPDEEEM